MIPFFDFLPKKIKRIFYRDSPPHYLIFIRMKTSIEFECVDYSIASCKFNLEVKRKLSIDFPSPPPLFEPCPNVLLLICYIDCKWHYCTYFADNYCLSVVGNIANLVWNVSSYVTIEKLESILLSKGSWVTEIENSKEVR